MAHLMRIACRLVHTGWAIRTTHHFCWLSARHQLSQTFHRKQTSLKKRISDSNPNGKMTTTASPVSFATISPAPDHQPAPISIDHLLHLLGQIRVPQEEPASPAAPSPPFIPATATATATEEPNVTLSISLSSIPPPALPLDSTIANRVIVLTHKEASRAEHALNEPHPACCHRTGLADGKVDASTSTTDSTNKNPVPGRNRALSAPVNGVNLPSKAALPTIKPVHLKKEDPSQKQTNREWRADLDRVSDVLSAMFADGDRVVHYT